MGGTHANFSSKAPTKLTTFSKVNLNDQLQLERKANTPMKPIEKMPTFYENEEEKQEVLSDMEKDVSAIRNYLQLLDQHSLHHFIIYKGKTVTTTPEYESFRRSFSHLWGPIMNATSALERVLEKNDIPVAVIDGPRIAELAVLEVVQENELLSCIANLDQIELLLEVERRNGGKAIKSKEGAAMAIQSLIRRFLARCRVTYMRLRNTAALIIQCCYRTWRCVQCTTQQLQKRRMEDNARWEAMQAEFKSDWKKISAHEHYVIHIPSLSVQEHLRLGVSDLLVRQNIQLPRIADAALSPHCHVIYVAPFHMPEEVLDFNKRMTERYGTYTSRLHIVVPENSDRLPPHFPLSSALLYSPKCQKKIKALIKGRPAYIVPGVASWQEKRLSETLLIPLLAPSPQSLTEYTTKSGAKTAFMESEVNVPIGAHDIYDTETFMLAFTKLMSGNLSVDRWLVKLDADYEHFSWAFLDVEKLESVLELRKEKEKMEQMNDQNPQSWLHPDIQMLARTKILKELSGTIAKNIVICAPHIYQNWDKYLLYLGRYGGVIEAEPKNVRGYPSVNMFIEPTGDISIHSTHDLMPEKGRYQLLAALFPSTTVPTRALEGASMSVAKNLYKKGVIGHVTINFVVFKDMGKKQLRMWGLDVEPGLGDYACSYKYFDLLRGAPPEKGEATGKKTWVHR